MFFILRPGIFPGASPDWVKARYESPYGEIRSDWRVSEGEIECSVTVPPNTTALLRLPTKSLTSVREGGQLITEVSGVKFIGLKGRHALYELQSGQFIFRANQEQ